MATFPASKNRFYEVGMTWSLTWGPIKSYPIGPRSS